MKIAFIGWNENGEKCLKALLQKGIGIDLVLVPKGYTTDTMFAIAKTAKITIHETDGTPKGIAQEIIPLKLDLILVASFPKLLKKEIIDIPRFGVINVHAAALPKYRGYHPINWAIIKDEKDIGVTVHYIEEGADNGNILAQKLIPITNNDNAITLRTKLTTEGARLLVNVVAKIVKNKKRLQGIEQNERDATFAPRRYPQDGKISWNNNTRDIFNVIRSLAHPYPNAFSFVHGEQIEIEKSFISKTPGEVLAKIKGHYLVATGDGVIMIKSKQPLKLGEILS